MRRITTRLVEKALVAGRTVATEGASAIRHWLCERLAGRRNFRLASVDGDDSFCVGSASRGILGVAPSWSPRGPACRPYLFEVQSCLRLLFPFPDGNLKPKGRFLWRTREMRPKCALRGDFPGYVFGRLTTANNHNILWVYVVRPQTCSGC